jgi:hypothetical protein
MTVRASQPPAPRHYLAGAKLGRTLATSVGDRHGTSTLRRLMPRWRFVAAVLVLCYYCADMLMVRCLRDSRHDACHCARTSRSTLAMWS